MIINMQGAVGDAIDSTIVSLSHPFFMVVFGLIFWFSIIWSLEMEERKKKGVKYWADQKDEMVVTLIGALIFLIWDDEIIQAYYDYREISGDAELKSYYYLLIAPAIDRVYWVIRKFRKKE